MNQLGQQALIQETSTKYLADLEQSESRYKNCISDFLTSDVKKCLVIETWSSKLGALRFINMLKQLKDDDDNQHVLGRYLSAENQTYVSWKQLLDVVDATGSVPRFTNLLVCEFPLSMKMEEIDSTLLKEIMQRLNLATSKKVIFIVSEQGFLDSYLKKIEMEAFLKIDGFGTKIISSIYASEAEALVEGAANGHLNDVVKLLKDGVNVNATSGSSTALLAAVKNGHKDVVLTLLRNGADIVSVESQQSPLHVAARTRQKNIVLALLEHDIDINIQGETGWTALHHAAFDGYLDIVTILLEYNANVDARTNQGSTALDLAAKRNYPEIVQALLNKGASCLLHRGENPLQVAAKRGHKDVVLVFLRNNIDVDSKGSYENSALIEAILNNRTDVIKTLLDYGADVNGKDRAGSTACHLAAERSNVEILEMLLTFGADKNAKNMHGDTPLHVAARTNCLEIVKFLMDKGAEVSFGNGENKTPLDIAAENHHDAIVALLRGRVNIRAPCSDVDIQITF